MSTRLALALPLALLLGCGAAPPPAAATPPAEAAPATAGSLAASAAPATSPSPSLQVAGDTKKAESSAPAKAATDAPMLSTITQDEILNLVNKNGELFNRCYTLGAGASKSYRAKVTVKATVSPVGAVNAVLVINSTAKNPKVDACVADAFKKLTFTRPAGSGATVFTFPLSFDGIEQVQ